MSDKDMKVTERLAYAHLLMEHFYAIDEAITLCRKVNGDEKFSELFPRWNDLVEQMKLTIYDLLKDCEPTLSEICERAMYADFFIKKENNYGK